MLTLLQFWSIKTGECLGTHKPALLGATDGISINSVTPIPRSADLYLVCNRSNTLHVLNIKGQVWHSVPLLHSNQNALQLVKSLSSGKREHGSFMTCTLSPKGQWAYAVAEDSIMYCFNMASGNLEQALPVCRTCTSVTSDVSDSQVHERPAIGVTHHPHHNLIATYADDGLLSLWKP